MLQPRDYGNSAYYHVGYGDRNAGNLGIQAPPAGWLGGLFTAAPNSASNLGKRVVQLYSRDPSVFSPTVGGAFTGIVGQHLVAFPDGSYTPWSGHVT